MGKIGIANCALFFNPNYGEAKQFWATMTSLLSISVIKTEPQPLQIQKTGQQFQNNLYMITPPPPSRPLSINITPQNVHFSLKKFD